MARKNVEGIYVTCCLPVGSSTEINKEVFKDVIHEVANRGCPGKEIPQC
ncbi:MAG: hypothetical protein IPI42_14660 [Saprospiraceae bacterium]|nr:hypothetical protein [Candidatus Parvibacillus calidus]